VTEARRARFASDRCSRRRTALRHACAGSCASPRTAPASPPAGCSCRAGACHAASRVRLRAAWSPDCNFCSRARVCAGAGRGSRGALAARPTRARRRCRPPSGPARAAAGRCARRSSGRGGRRSAARGGPLRRPGDGAGGPWAGAAATRAGGGPLGGPALVPCDVARGRASAATPPGGGGRRGPSVSVHDGPATRAGKRAAPCGESVPSALLRGSAPGALPHRHARHDRQPSRPARPGGRPAPGPGGPSPAPPPGAPRPAPPRPARPTPPPTPRAASRTAC
jgi:hypothetical protein